jgi:hypothetical protein
VFPDVHGLLRAFCDALLQFHNTVPSDLIFVLRHLKLCTFLPLLFIRRTFAISSSVSTTMYCILLLLLLRPFSTTTVLNLSSYCWTPSLVLSLSAMPFANKRFHGKGSIIYWEPDFSPYLYGLSIGLLFSYNTIWKPLS